MGSCEHCSTYASSHLHNLSKVLLHQHACEAACFWAVQLCHGWHISQSTRRAATNTLQSKRSVRPASRALSTLVTEVLASIPCPTAEMFEGCSPMRDAAYSYSIDVWWRSLEMLARTGAKRHAAMLACCHILICTLAGSAAKAPETVCKAGAPPPAGHHTHSDISALHAAQRELRGLLLKAQSTAAELEAAAERYLGLLAARAAAGLAGVAGPGDGGGAAALEQEAVAPLGAGEHTHSVLSTRLAVQPLAAGVKGGAYVGERAGAAAQDQGCKGPAGTGLPVSTAQLGSQNESVEASSRTVDEAFTAPSGAS